MILCVAGDIHGAIGRLYSDLADFERALGIPFAWVLQVGDFGVWPDPGRIDSATRKPGGAGDFPRWFAERRRVPRPTLFIHSNHEDVEWLASRGGLDLVPGLSGWHRQRLPFAAGIAGTLGRSDQGGQRREPVAATAGLRGRGMDEFPEGFEAYEKAWNQDALPDAQGPRSAVVWNERERFLEILQELYPQVLQEFQEAIFWPRSRSGKVIELGKKAPEARRPAGSSRISHSEALRAIPEIRSFLERWNLNCPWMLKVATLTLRAWSHQHSNGEELEAGWRNYDHRVPVDLGVPACAPAKLVWDLQVATEGEYRKVVEEYIEERKLEAFKAGLLPRIGPQDGRVKLPPERRHEYLLMHLVEEMTTDRIIEWFYLERGEEVGKGGIERALGELSKVVGIKLPPRQGRSRDSRGKRGRVRAGPRGKSL